MKRKLKILTVERKNDDGYWIAGVFNTDEEVNKYIKLYLFKDAVTEVQDFDYPNEVNSLPNGEYAYQVVVVNPEKFVIEQILAPKDFSGFLIDDDPKLPLRIFLSAKDAEDVKQKCLKIMAARIAMS